MPWSTPVKDSSHIEPMLPPFDADLLHRCHPASSETVTDKQAEPRVIFMGGGGRFIRKP